MFDSAAICAIKLSRDRWEVKMGVGDGQTLTVTFPCFTASIQDFCDQTSGAYGNFRLWTNHWSQLYLPIYTGLMEAVLCPPLTTRPGFFPLQVHTLIAHCCES